jgi:hypothetical protein
MDSSAVDLAGLFGWSAKAADELASDPLRQKLRPPVLKFGILLIDMSIHSDVL